MKVPYCVLYFDIYKHFTYKLLSSFCKNDDYSHHYISLAREFPVGTSFCGSMDFPFQLLELALVLSSIYWLLEVMLNCNDVILEELHACIGRNAAQRTQGDWNFER